MLTLMLTLMLNLTLMPALTLILALTPPLTLSRCEPYGQLLQRIGRHYIYQAAATPNLTLTLATTSTRRPERCSAEP